MAQSLTRRVTLGEYLISLGFGLLREVLDSVRSPALCYDFQESKQSEGVTPPLSFRGGRAGLELTGCGFLPRSCDLRQATPPAQTLYCTSVK